MIDLEAIATKIYSNFVNSTTILFPVAIYSYLTQVASYSFLDREGARGEGVN
jgi:hypothetical protein